MGSLHTRTTAPAHCRLAQRLGTATVLTLFLSPVTAQDLPCNPCFDAPQTIRPDDAARHPDAGRQNSGTGQPRIISVEELERLGITFTRAGDSLRVRQAWSCRGPIRERLGDADWLVEGCGRANVELLKISPADTEAEGPLFTVRFTERGLEVASSESALLGSAAAAHQALQTLSQQDAAALRARVLRAAD